MRGSDDFIYFVLLSPSNASYSFHTYVDGYGEEQYVKQGFDNFGNPIRKMFKFTQSNRMIWIPKERTAEVEFLRNHPECKDSPNGDYVSDQDNQKIQTGVMFKEINDGKDAQVAVDTQLKQLEALNAAAKLKGQELSDVAALCGSFKKDERTLKHHVLVYAKNNPESFLLFMKSPDRDARALLKQAISAGTITKKGFMLMYGDVYLGNNGRENEDSIVEKIMSDKKLKEAIEVDVKRKTS